MSSILHLAVMLQLANFSSAPPATIADGVAELSRAYPQLDISLERRTANARASGDAGIRVVVLHDATGALRHSDKSAMGAAVRTEGGVRVVYVFFDRVRAEAERYGVSTALVLACVIEHELGHLLLPGGAHSRIGLMQPVWRAEDFRSANRGQLRFTPDEMAALERR
jgi:hypothetical protein